MIDDKIVAAVEKHIAFQRREIISRPLAGDLPTLEDTDETKMPALKKLLLNIFSFCTEMQKSGLVLREDDNSCQPRQNSYLLTDREYSRACDFRIIVKSDWLNPQYRRASPDGFDFHLGVYQVYRQDISDSLIVKITHLNTAHLTYSSWRMYARYLEAFYDGESFFDGLQMGPTRSSSFGSLGGGLTFNTPAFNLAVDDACTVLDKIVRRKDRLENFIEIIR